MSQKKNKIVMAIIREIEMTTGKKKDFGGQKVAAWQCINAKEGFLEHTVYSRGRKRKCEEKKLGKRGCLL